MLENRLSKCLEEKKQQNALRQLRIFNPHDKDILNLMTNDYLDLTKHPKVKKNLQAAIEFYGTSSSGSPVVNGYQVLHKQLEDVLCEWFSFPCAMIWASGFSANYNILKYLIREDDLVLVDRLSHYSSLSGIMESQAQIIRYRHCDMEHLEALLQKFSSVNKITFVITESLFSMDGDYPDFKALAALKEKYSFIWILDEAHAVGWYGPKGQGLAAHYGVLKSVDILIATLGKALASQGAFSLFRNSVIKDYLINYAREFLYTTYPNPASMAAAIASIEIIRTELFREQATWHALSYALREELQKFFPKLSMGNSPILPLIVGENESTLALAEEFQKVQIYVGAIRPPSVPKGTSRLRLSLNRNLDKDEILNRMMPIIKKWRKRK